MISKVGGTTPLLDFFNFEGAQKGRSNYDFHYLKVFPMIKNNYTSTYRIPKNSEFITHCNDMYDCVQLQIS